MPRISRIRASFLILAISQWRARASSLIIAGPQAACHRCNNRPSPSCFANKLLTISSRSLFASPPSSSRRRKFALIARAHHEASSSTAMLHQETLHNGNNNTSFSQHPPSRQQRVGDNTENDYEKIESAPLDLPRHIAFICDGNSRWAKQKSLPESMGHVAGADRVVQLIKSIQQIPGDTQQLLPKENNNKQSKVMNDGRIEYCTLFAFSTENWSRPSTEISALFQLIERMAKQYRNHEAVREGKIRIELLGNLDDERIPEGARKELRALEIESKEACVANRMEGSKDGNYCNDNVLTICLAINYGGRADILQAAQSLAQSIASGEVSSDELLYESQITKRLCTSNIPDPDLIVRTGGERRLSNFLLWNAAYAELFFTDVLWPDFDAEALGEALRWYSKRKRRFGGRR